MKPETAAASERGDAPKGDVLGDRPARGHPGREANGELIPLAHPLPLAFVGRPGRLDQPRESSRSTPRRATVGRTGVEMEAMTAAAVAALTVYDMVKGIERGVRSRRSS